MFFTLTELKIAKKIRNIRCVIIFWILKLTSEAAVQRSSEKSSENMQQIYRRTPMPKWDFNKVVLQMYGIYSHWHKSYQVLINTQFWIFNMFLIFPFLPFYTFSFYIRIQFIRTLVLRPLKIKEKFGTTKKLPFCR